MPKRNPISTFFNFIDPKMPHAQGVIRHRDKFLRVSDELGLDPAEKVQIVGAYLLQDVPLPVVKYSLPNQAALIVKGAVHDVDFDTNNVISVFNSRPFGADTQDFIKCGFPGFSVANFRGGPADKEFLLRGFPPNLVFGPYEKNHRTYSLVVMGEEERALWAFIKHFAEDNQGIVASFRRVIAHRIAPLRAPAA